MRFMPKIAGLVIAATLALAAVFLLAGPQRFWEFFGDRDLGSVSFSSLVRRTTPNDALACPPDLCAATVDIVVPLYALPAANLRREFADVMTEEQNIEKVSSDDNALIDRYVQATPILGFPDTIVVQFVDLPNGKSSLMLYSRSKFGRSDLGTNRERIERWLKRLNDRLRTGNP